jgi:hypothetical protein
MSRNFGLHSPEQSPSPDPRERGSHVALWIIAIVFGVNWLGWLLFGGGVCPR